ncbi:MAG: hypothetical protein ACTJG2_00715 [Candidatus Saccharimonadales bacterium]
MGKRKNRTYEVAQSHVECLGEKDLRKRQKELAKRALAMPSEIVQRREETLPRHTRFDDKRRKGGRQGQKRRAIDDAS